MINKSIFVFGLLHMKLDFLLSESEGKRSHLLSLSHVSSEEVTSTDDVQILASFLLQKSRRPSFLTASISFSTR